MKKHCGIWLFLLLSCWCGAVEEDRIFGLRVGTNGPEPDPAAIPELVKLKGEEFAKAFEGFSMAYRFWKEEHPSKPLVTTEDLLRVLEHATLEDRVAVGKEPDFTSVAFQFGELLKEAIEDAEDSGLDRLAQVVSQRPRNDLFWPTRFEGIVARLLTREIQMLGKAGAPPIEIEPLESPQLDGAPEVSADLHEAWRRFLAVGERQVRQHDAPAIGITVGGKGYHALLDELLRGGGVGLPEKLALYYQDGGCISDGSFSRTVGPARWLALVRERRLREAIGAAFAVGGLGDEKLFAVRGEFLEVCGVDRAQLEAGRWMTRLPAGAEGFTRSFSTSRGEPELALEALAAGMERDARYVVGLARLVPPPEVGQENYDLRRCFIDALGIIIARRPGEAAAAAPPNLPPLPDDLRRAAVEQLLVSLTPTFPIPHLEMAVEKSEALLLREAVQPLRVLLENPSLEIQRSAAKALRALGEKVKELPPTGPVQPKSGTELRAGQEAGAPDL